MAEFKKLAIIHCRQTSRYYTGKKAVRNAALQVNSMITSGPIQVIDTTDCGGCPGQKIFGKIEALLQNGAEGILLASCITGVDQSPFPCANFKKIETEIFNRFKGRITSIETAF